MAQVVVPKPASNAQQIAPASCLQMWNLGLSIPCTFFFSCLMTSSAQHTQFVFSVENMEGGKSAEFVLELRPEWAPAAAARFETLVDQGFFDGSYFFKVVSGFIAQFGLAKDPVVTAAWEKQPLPKEGRKVQNKRGKVAFALVDGKDGKETSSTQIVINAKDNPMQDTNGLVPFAEVTAGMRVVDRLYSWYGVGKKGPQESSIKEEGNAYLEKNFPKLSYIKSVRRVEVPAFAEEPPRKHAQTSEFALHMVAFVAIILCGGGWMAWSMRILPAKHVSS